MRYFVHFVFLFLLLRGDLLWSNDALNRPEQKIKDIYLSNINGDGSQDWEVKGEEASIYEKHIDIDKMEANYCSKENAVLITSNKARLNKENMNIELKDEVYIEDKDGATLTTDSLNWQREKNHIETDDWVKTNKDPLQITAKGLSADTQLKEVDFEKEVEVIIDDKEKGNYTTVICDGPLEIEYNSGKAIFNKDVIFTNEQAKLHSDKATLFFDRQEKKILKMVSEGNVKIVKEGNTTYSEKATYLADKEKIVLEGKPRLIYFPEDGEDAEFLK